MSIHPSCMCACEHDGDLSEFQSVVRRKARIQHACCECSDAIMPGDEYVRAVGKWSGEFSAYKTCKTCWSIRETLSPCSCFGWLKDDIWQCIGIDYITGEEAEWVCEEETKREAEKEEAK